ncbi:hypothetical protein [Pannonibacter phragmitetus]|uniref:hypothetical protein n=1 Tax=Pannonibacter phragmitetus TaxID=121719 RepID=UPI003D2ED546
MDPEEREYSMLIPPDVAGTAALAICESLLLALNDAKVLPESEIIGVLTDAAAAHEATVGTPEEEELGKAVSRLIIKIINSGNSVRRV